MDKANTKEDVLNALMSETKDALEKLHTEWLEIGYNDEMQSLYRAEVYKHVRDLYNDMLSEVRGKKFELLQDLKQLMNQATTLSKELGKETPAVHEMLPLYEARLFIHEYVNNLQRIKEERLEYLNELLCKEREICKYLGVKTVGIDKELPTEEELENFKCYLEKQEMEKSRLESIFHSTRLSIINMMDSLGIIPPTPSFENLICNNPENFIFSTGNMTKLREVHNQFTVEVENSKMVVAKLKEQLVSLWKHLDEPSETCRNFLERHTGYDAVTINALSAEINVCKERRKANIAKCVNQMRTELMNLWDMCKYQEEERKNFSPFYSQTYTDDLLTLHELEIDKLRKYYESNKQTFSLLEKREELLQKIKGLLQRADDPDRFQNRGGQLLAEEKERKIIGKKLPKIEEELKYLANEYESTHGETFKINGLPIEEYISNSHDALRMELKNAKKSVKCPSITPHRETKDKSNKHLLSASKYTPNKTNISHNINMYRTPKRKLLSDRSPNTSSSKCRNISAKKARPTVVSTKVRRSGQMQKKVLTPKSGQQRKSGSKHKEEYDDTYGQFQEHLDERDELRSSLLPERILQNSNKSNLKTPTRTPNRILPKNLLAPPTIFTPGATPKLSASKLSARKSPHSPRTIHTPKLTPAAKNLPMYF